MAGLSVESESDPKETFRLDRLRHQRHIEFVPTYGGGSVAEERVQRRLAAILAADVVDYSRLMGEDEFGTRQRFNSHLNGLVAPKIAVHHGRAVITMSDGLLVTAPHQEVNP